MTNVLPSITFDQGVKGSSGNITLKNGADNTTIEQFSINSPYVCFDSVINDFETDIEDFVDSLNTITWSQNPDSAYLNSGSLKFVTDSAWFHADAKFTQSIDLTGYDTLAAWVYTSVAGSRAQMFIQSTGWNWVQDTLLPLSDTGWTRVVIDLHKTGIDISVIWAYGVQFEKPGTYYIDRISLKKKTPNKVTLIPYGNLSPSTDYYILIDDGAISNLSNENFTGITTPTGWNFTTISPTKKNNSYNLNLVSSWEENVAPTPSTIAVWDNTVTTSNTVKLGADLFWGGLTIKNPGGPVTINSGNVLTLGSSGINMGNATQNLTLNNQVHLAKSQAWNIGSNNTLTVDSITSEDYVTLIKNGGGQLVLNGPASIPTGSLISTQGKVKLGNIAAADKIGSVTINNSSQLWTDQNGIIATNITINGVGPDSRGALYAENDDGLLSYNGNIVLNTDASIGSFGVKSTTNFNGVISGAGKFTFGSGGADESNSHTYVLYAVNTYTGNLTTIESNYGSQTHLKLGIDNALPTSTIVLMDANWSNTTTDGAGAFIDLNGHNQEVAGVQCIGSTKKVISGSGTLSTASLGVNKGNVYINANSTVDITTPYSCSISDSSALIVNGTLSGSQVSISTKGALVIGNNSQTGSVEGDLINNGSVEFSLTTPYSFSGNISGTGSVVKNGTDTLILTGACTFSGPTDVKSGVLVIDSVISASSVVTVASGASLCGAGVIQSPVVVENGAVLEPAGSSTGKLTTGALTLNDSSVINIQLGTVSDLIAVEGNLVLDGFINLTIPEQASGEDYTLFTYSGTLVNNEARLVTTPAGPTVSIIAMDGKVTAHIAPAEQPPVAHFTNDISAGNTPLTVHFSDSSSGLIDSWKWDFGDESSSTDTNPTHIYSKEGLYDVKLIVPARVVLIRLPKKISSIHTEVDPIRYRFLPDTLICDTSKSRLKILATLILRSRSHGPILLAYGLFPRSSHQYLQNRNL